jgi:hypothetical protein
MMHKNKNQGKHKAASSQPKGQEIRYSPLSSQAFEKALNKAYESNKVAWKKLAAK